MSYERQMEKGKRPATGKSAPKETTTIKGKKGLSISGGLKGGSKTKYTGALS